MKNLFIAFALLMSASVNASAENNLSVKPFKTTQNVTLSGSSRKGATSEDYFEICMNYDKTYIGLQFDVLLPTGFILQTAYSAQPGTLLGLDDAYHDISLASVTSTVEGYTQWRVLVYNTDKTETGQINQGSTGDDVIRMYFGTDATIADGIYPIYVKGTYMNVTATESYPVAIGTSYCIVGDVTGSLSAEGILTSTVNTSLATESAITSLDISNITECNGTFAYIPKREVKVPSELKANVKISVPAPTNDYSSICLPYDVKDLDYDCFTLNDSKSGDGYAHFDEAESLTAGTPAIIDEAWNLELGEQTLVGVAPTTITDATSYYVKNDKFCAVNGSAVIPALRGYWTSANPVKGFIIENDGDETFISNIEDDQIQTVYNVSGMRLNKAQKGVNIVNGKKVLVK